MHRVAVLLAAVLLLLTFQMVPAGAAGSVGDDSADAVWGQPDLMTADCLDPPTSTSLCLPFQSALDSAGRLWVTDYGNHRVLMYPAGSKTASKVLGQVD